MQSWMRVLQESRNQSNCRDKNIYDPDKSLPDLKKCDLHPVIFRSKRFFLWFISIKVREEKLRIYLSPPNCLFPASKCIILLSRMFSLVYYTLWYRAIYLFAASTFFLVVFHLFDSSLTENTAGSWIVVGRLLHSVLNALIIFAFNWWFCALLQNTHNFGVCIRWELIIYLEILV